MKVIKLAFSLSPSDNINFLNSVTDLEGKIPEYFGCSICQNLLYEPQECSNCFKPYC